MAWFDELQELGKSKYGKEAGEILEKVIKLGRALGVIILIGTQIPDKDSLPTGITRNVNTRFCCSVADQTANDMILGTSAYKQGYRATVFEPVVEAGWGILPGSASRRPAVVLRQHHRRAPGRGPRDRRPHRAGTLPAPADADPRHRRRGSTCSTTWRRCGRTARKSAGTTR